MMLNFQKFVLHFNKVYPNEEERAYRLKVFNANLEKLKAFNSAMIGYSPDPVDNNQA